jgi:hypothetical protein
MRPRASILAAALALLGLPLAAQTSAPDGVQASTATGRAMGSKKDRVLWVFPNYRTVDEERSLPSISSKYKLTIATRDSFDPYAFPIAGFFAGIDQAEDKDAVWGRGASGYGKRYFAAFTDQTVSNMMSEAAFPILLHQDPRYFRLGRGGFWHRAGYAASRVFVTRTDDGEAQFNYSEFGGNAVMAAAGNLYYPADDRTFGTTATRFGVQIAFDLVADVSKEFWPDVREWLVGR